MQRQALTQIDQLQAAQREGPTDGRLTVVIQTGAEGLSGPDILTVLAVDVVRRVQRAQLLRRCAGLGLRPGGVFGQLPEGRP